jgi:hypothetical protein
MEAVAPLVRFALELHRGWCDQNGQRRPRLQIANTLRGTPYAVLVKGHYQALETLEEVALTDAAFIAFHGARQIDPRQVIGLERSALRRWTRPASADDARRFVLEWTRVRLPNLQALVEAVPKELAAASADAGGLVDALLVVGRGYAELSGYFEATPAAGSSASLDAVAGVFHRLVRELYQTVGCRYHPVRLYQDDLDSPAGELLVRNTQQLHPFAHSVALSSIDDLHAGTVVRLREPLVQMPDAQHAQECRWMGSVELYRPPGVH